MPTSTPHRCSDTSIEPLPGTAKTGQGYVLLEYPGPWSRDVLDGKTFTPEFTAALKSHLKAHRMGLQLIRKPGREGRHTGTHTVLLVFSEHNVIEKLSITDPSHLLECDLSAPGLNHASPLSHPVLLICTHGKRDVCCAIKGRPVAAAIAPHFPQDCVWESSHTKGHRFAPSMLLMPWNYSYGRLNAEAATEMLNSAQRGELFLPGCRGRGTLSAAEQVAELSVAQLLGDVAPGSLSIHGTHVRAPNGREFEVELERREIAGIISSCGDTPKAGTAWVAVEVQERA